MEKGCLNKTLISTLNSKLNKKQKLLHYMRWNTTFLLENYILPYYLFTILIIPLPTLQELPEEYQTLQEAADTLAFAHNAKMIQYIWSTI